MGLLDNLKNKYLELLNPVKKSLATTLAPGGTVDRSTGGVPSYLLNAGATMGTLLGTAKTSLGQSQLLPYSARNSLLISAQNDLAKASRVRAMTNTQNTGFNTALNVAGPTIGTMLSAYGGAKMAVTPLLNNLIGLGVGGALGGGINKLQGGSFGQGAIGGALSTPLYTGAAGLGGKLLGGLSSKLAPNLEQGINPYLKLIGNPTLSQTTRDTAKNMLLKNALGNITAKGLEAGTGNAIVDALSPTNNPQDRLGNAAKGFGTGFAFGAGSETVGSGLKIGKFGLDKYNKLAPEVTQAGKVNLGAKNYHPDDLMEMKDFTDYIQKKWKPLDKPVYEADIRDMAVKYGINPDQPNAKIAAKFAKILDKHWDVKNNEPRGFTDVMKRMMDQTGGASLKDTSAPEPTKVRGKAPSAPEPLPWEAPGYKPAEISSTDVQVAKAQSQVVSQLAPGEFKDSFAKWIGKRQSADTKATLRASQYANLPSNKAEEVIRALDEGATVTKDTLPVVQALRKELDVLYAEVKQIAPGTKYRENYLPHIWEQSPQEVAQLYQQAKQTFKFSGERTIPTYSEGLQMGLTPKFSNPAEILQYYIKNLEQTKANIEFFKELKQKGLIVPASATKNNANFAPITAPGFPQSFTRIDNGTAIQGNWYAPRDIANKINQVFTPQDYGTIGTVLDKLGNASGKIQDITMSGGLPATPLNAWTVAQMTKEMLAGRIVSPLKSLLLATAPGQSEKYFASNANQIIKMQEAGIPVNTSYKISNLVDAPTVSKTLGEKVGKAWNAAVNDPTFERFAPMLQINLFNDIERQALRGGKTQQEAIQVAAQAVKNFYGVKGSAAEAMGSKLGKDFTRAVFFAPKYRESMVNFWVNNLKALTNPMALENRANVKFVVGATLTYLAMDQINQANTGKHMWENPSNKQDKMLIKTGDGYIGVPFLSSIATVPRALAGMASNAVQGNFAEVMNQGKSFLSSAIRPALDVATNQDYFGGNITNPDNPQWGDRAAYLAGQYMHPYVREGLNVTAQGLPDNLKGKLGLSKDPVPAYQTISKAMELPFRFYNNKNGKDPLDTGYYFDTKADVLKGADKQTKTQWELLHPTKDGSQQLDPGVLSSQQKAMLYLNNPKLQLLELQLAKSMQQQIGQAYDPVWDLPSDKRNQIFAARTSLPGEKNTVKKELGTQDWYSAFNKKEASFFDSLPSSGNVSPRPQPSTYVQQQMDLKNWSDPQVRSYLDANTAYNNDLRTSLGLSPIAGYVARNKVKSVRLSSKAPARRRITLGKVKKLKLAKIPKPKKLKNYSTAIKRIKLKKISTKLAKVKMPRLA